MNTEYAKQLIGKTVDISYMNRNNMDRVQIIVMDVEVIPLYGPYLIGDILDVPLSSVVRAVPLS